MKQGTKNLIFWAVVILVVAVIFFIMRGGGSSDEKTMKCIAEKSKVYVSKSCSHCAQQKEILGDYLNLFELVDVGENPDLIKSENITSVPTWVIGGQKYSGVRTVEELKELTGC